MATREIKTRFKLEGEAEFKRAMTDAANATKVLDSEMKLAKAQFEQTGDAQQYAAEQARILREKIEEQKSAVQAAERAMQQLADNGVSKNDKTYQMWATRLNNAKTTLTGLETQLDKAETGFEDVNAAAESTDSKLDSIDKELRFQNTLKILEDVRDRFNAIVRGAARAGKAIWDMETDAGKWADDLATAASQAGMDVETYQAWDYASRFIDTSVDDIVKAYKSLTSAMTSTNTDTVAMFAKLGVATRDAELDARSYVETFFDVIDALGRETNETKRAEYAQKLLGGSWRNLNPLIEAGSKAYQDMADEGRRVAVVSEETVTKLGGLNDQQEQMNAALEKTKMTLLGSLAEPFEKVAAGITEATTALNSFLESDEGKQALSELGDALNGLITAFLGEDNGKGTFAAIVDTAKEAVNGFTAALEWLKDNTGAVKTALTTFAAAWGGLNVAPPVLKALHLIQEINWGGVSKAVGEASGGSAATGAASAAGGGFFSKAAGFGISIGSLLQGGAAAYGLYKADELYASLPGGRSAIKDIGYNLGLYNYTPHSESGQQIYESIRQAVADGMNAADFTKQKYGSESLGEYYTQKNETFARWDAEGRKYNKNQTLENAYAQLEKLANEAAAKLEEASEAAGEKGKEAVENFTGAMEDNAQQAVDAAQQMGQSVTEETDREMSFMELIGENAATGLANGIDARAQDAVNAATRLANQVEAAMRNALDIHSPSRVLMRMGEFTAQGFAQGIDDGMARVEAAAARMSRAAAVEPTYRSGGSWGADPAGAQAGASAPGGNGGSVNATIVMDKTVVGRMVAPIVNETIGAAVAAARR